MSREKSKEKVKEEEEEVCIVEQRKERWKVCSVVWPLIHFPLSYIQLLRNKHKHTHTKAFLCEHTPHTMPLSISQPVIRDRVKLCRLTWSLNMQQTHLLMRVGSCIPYLQSWTSPGFSTGYCLHWHILVKPIGIGIGIFENQATDLDTSVHSAKYEATNLSSQLAVF